jgi:hypothetical protein
VSKGSIIIDERDYLEKIFINGRISVWIILVECFVMKGFQFRARQIGKIIRIQDHLPRYILSSIGQVYQIFEISVYKRILWLVLKLDEQYFRRITLSIL